MHVSPRCGGVGKERLQKSTMDIMQWLTQNPAGEFCFTMLVSMVPVVELRGGIPFGVARGLPVWAAYLAAIIGNMLPVPFILSSRPPQRGRSCKKAPALKPGPR